MTQENPEENGSFFGWFVKHISIDSNKIVENINEELWPKSPQYYLLRERACGQKAKEGRAGQQNSQGRPLWDLWDLWVLTKCVLGCLCSLHVGFYVL